MEIPQFFQKTKQYKLMESNPVFFLRLTDALSVFFAKLLL